jgi:hypothetical protein
MTKKLEDILDIGKSKEPLEAPPADIPAPSPFTLEEKLEEFDKIASALPRVRGLGDVSDAELDGLAKRAEDAYEDIMDLAMQVEPKYSARMFEVATGMLNAAITAKTNKIDKKLKMVDLQLKKLSIDKKDGGSKGSEVEGQGFIVTDRNSILAKLKDLKS